MHLAAMTNLPIVGIFGPTPEARWLPVRSDNVTAIRGAACDPACCHRLCHADSRCMMELSVDVILAAANVYLSDDARANNANANNLSAQTNVS